MSEIYTHGHHESVLRSHRARTLENSAKYLESLLQPGQDVLDVGCGPGTITVGLAERVAPGMVIGLDRAESVIAEAMVVATESGQTNISFTTGDVHGLEFPDASFDIVHTHQVLQHLVDPIDALCEMRRVLRPGGILAVRDADFGGFVWSPESDLLTRWMELYHEVTTHNHAQADAGRHLLEWVRAAGFEDVDASSSTWTFAEPKARQWWGGIWAERLVASSLAEQALSYGLTTRDELDAIAAAWRTWIDEPAGYFAVLHGEVLARR